MRNKLLAMLLALCMVMTMLPVSVFAGDCLQTCEKDAEGNVTKHAEGCPNAGNGGDEEEEEEDNTQKCGCDNGCTAAACAASTGGSCGHSNCGNGSTPPEGTACGVNGCTENGKVHTGDHTFTCNCPESGENVHQNHQGTYKASAADPSGKCPACRSGGGSTTDPTKPGGEYGDYDENNHCLCDDSACGSVSHRGPAMGTIGDHAYGAVCVNVPENGSICNACLEAIAAKSGNNQGGDKKDDEQKPAQPTTPTATPANPNAPQKAEDFIDIQPGTWYNDSVTAMLQKGWFVGQTGGSFAPRNPTTGAEVVVILSRVLGYDLVTTGANWSAEATEWAAAQGLSEGISITTTGGLTRQDLILMLWRAADKPDSSYPLNFSDIGGVSGDALTALRWAVENGIVQGNPDGTANPTGATLRCEMAALMVRYDNAVNG